MRTPFAQGMPILILAVSAARRSRNGFRTASWTKRIFRAAQRWPLKARAPSRHADGRLQVGVGQDHGRVLGAQAEEDPQARPLRMQAGQPVGHRLGTDEGEDVDPAAFQEGIENGRPVSRKDVDRARREAGRERLEKEIEKQDAEAGRLDDHRVAGQEGGHNEPKRLEQRIIIRPGAQGDAPRLVADEADDALLPDQGPRGPVSFDRGLNQSADQFDRPVELGLELDPGFGDFPH